MIIRILLVISALSVLGLCALFVQSQANLPVMHVSTSTGECVRVIGGGSCSDFPIAYSRVWVQ